MTGYTSNVTVVVDSEKGDALLVLCEEELLAFDLQAPRYVPSFLDVVHLMVIIYKSLQLP